MSPGTKGPPVDELGADVMEESLHVWPFHISILSCLSGSQWSFWGLRAVLNTTLPCLQLLLLTDEWTPTAGAFLLLIHSDLLGNAKTICCFTLGFQLPSQFLSWLGSWFQCWSHGLWPQRETEFSLTSLPCHCLLPDPSPHNVLLCGQLLKNAGFGIGSDTNPKSHIAQFSHHCLSPSQISPEVYKKTHEQISNTSQVWGKQRLQQEAENKIWQVKMA